MKTARATSIATLLMLFAMAAPAAAQTGVALNARVDSIFSRWNSQSVPGCATAVSQNGATIFARAYGMADLEDNIRNSPATVFEAGSVSKQFTAAAIILLAQQGKLSLDDGVRKYVPELPENNNGITLRHMLTHTSGLRDWGSVAGIGGWPRGSRVYTHAHVVDILSRQRELNFPPGQQYSYSNSGYNLLAVIVDRVSGMSFADFSREQIFRPLGMNNTQWRDDYTRVVPGRSVAYSARGSGWAMNMPFENVHGNGGLLTTVGDLLIWTENLETGKLGGAPFLEMMHRRGVLNSGDTITYASGLMVGRYGGVREVSHTGSTAGYRAFLARYPDQKLAVALLCNVASVDPGGVGHNVADIFLAPLVAQGGAPATGARGAGAAAVAAGANANAGAGAGAGRGAGAVAAAGGGARAGGGRGAGAGAGAGAGTGTGAGRGGAAAYTPTSAELNALAGDYYSPDSESTFTVQVEDGRVFLFRRPATRIALTPVAADQFSASGFQGVRFIRNAAGAVIQLSVRQDRVFDLRFDRVAR